MLGETAGILLSMPMHVDYAASSLILLEVFFVTLTARLLSKSYHGDIQNSSVTMTIAFI